MSLKYLRLMFLVWLACMAIIMIAGKIAWELSINPYVVVGLAVTLLFLIVNAVAIYLVQRDRKMRSNIRALHKRVQVLENVRSIPLHIRLQASLVSSALQALDIPPSVPDHTLHMHHKEERLQSLELFLTQGYVQLLMAHCKSSLRFIQTVTLLKEKAEAGLTDVA